MHIGEEPTRASEARLYFVGHQQYAISTADLGCFLEKAFWRNHDAGFALDWFNQERAGVQRNGCAECLSVAEWDHLETGRERAEAIAILFVAREADDRDCAPVKIVGADDDFSFAIGDALDLVPPLPRRFDSCLDCLGARVHG